MAFAVTLGIVDQLTLRVYCVVWSTWMLKRSMWPVAHPHKSVLQEGSKGLLPEGAVALSYWLAGARSVHASLCEDLQ